MTQTVKLIANSTFQKIADGPTQVILNPVIGVSALVIKTGSAPSANFANTFTLKSGVVDGGLNPITIANGSSAYIKSLSGERVIVDYILMES